MWTNTIKLGGSTKEITKYHFDIVIYFYYFLLKKKKITYKTPTLFILHWEDAQGYLCLQKITVVADSKVHSPSKPYSNHRKVIFSVNKSVSVPTGCKIGP